jgi:hypothetical protein
VIDLNVAIQAFFAQSITHFRISMLSQLGGIFEALASKALFEGVAVVLDALQLLFPCHCE